MVTVHKKRRKSLQGGVGSNNYVFLINASDDYTACIFDDIKTAIYRNAIEDYFRAVRSLDRLLKDNCYLISITRRDVFVIDEIMKIDKFIMSGAYNFDMTAAKQIHKFMHEKCKKEFPKVYKILYGG